MGKGSQLWAPRHPGAAGGDLRDRIGHARRAPRIGENRRWARRGGSQARALAGVAPRICGDRRRARALVHHARRGSAPASVRAFDGRVAATAIERRTRNQAGQAHPVSHGGVTSIRRGSSGTWLPESMKGGASSNRSFLCGQGCRRGSACRCSTSSMRPECRWCNAAGRRCRFACSCVRCLPCPWRTVGRTPSGSRSVSGICSMRCGQRRRGAQARLAGRAALANAVRHARIGESVRHP